MSVPGLGGGERGGAEECHLTVLFQGRLEKRNQSFRTEGYINDTST